MKMFDPTQFLEEDRAARGDTPSTFENFSSKDASPSKVDKPREMRRFSAERERSLGALGALGTLGGPEDAALPWADNLMAMVNSPAPDFLTEKSWERLLFTAVDTSRRWGRKALEMGWTELDIFGCNPDPIASRVDRNGVVISVWRMLSPLTIEDVTPFCWVLADRRGSTLKFPRMERLGQVPMWRAYPPFAGP